VALYAGQEKGSNDRSSQNREGVDTLAWYVILCVQGPQWEIYVPIPMIAWRTVNILGDLSTDGRTQFRIQIINDAAAPSRHQSLDLR
jgi:hypothetical protein